ncbi:SoxR reducing system RseC family protein [Lonepinella sp. MS14435]|uniref:SoxR reducing system RseC family protein n=1 Tax=unclassified Lonepinella TaxID=2642006 RepID=UPI0036D82C6A
MITESAVVIDYQAGVATVKCQSQSACGSCSAQSACGTSALAELTGKVGEHIFTLDTITPLRIGQTVEIGLEERSLLFSALLLYLVPLLTILVTTFIGEKLFQQELIHAIFIFFCTALSLVVIRFYAKKLQKKSAFKPILLRVV